GDTLAAHTLTPHWEFSIQHCPSGCHLHPLTSSDTASGQVTAESDGFPSKFRLEFTATDSRGMSSSQVVELDPRTIELHVQSDPAGVELSLNGASSAEPLTASMIAGEPATVVAPPSAVLGGVEYLFAGWSDGGERIHEVTSLQSETVVAEYKLPGELEEPPTEEPPSQAPPTGGTSQPPTVKPPVSTPVRKGSLRLVSRPAGVSLRVGAFHGKSPFSLQLPLGDKTFLLAPRTTRRNGRVLYFKRWVSPGRPARTGRRYPLTVPDSARFVAVFGPR
ncbi:MAG TPA: hypothetical protein VFJ53_01030, partial [Solirubrobacterales bacterium]|nr:hypothetical protein [Solirubrobacterales bacterium]